MARIAAVLVMGMMLCLSRPSLADGPADLERGVAMAKQGQWLSARRYLLDALRAMPADPVVLLNLGLAHDRMGGHEAEAMAWFRAYLEAAPEAANAPQVKARIKALDLALEGRVQQLLSIAGRIAGEAAKPQEKAAILSTVMRAHAEAGDIAAAQAAERQILPGGGKPNWGIAALAAAHARKGDMSTALAEARRPDLGAARSWAMAEIAVEQAIRGDISGAEATARSISHKAEADFALSRIGVLWARRTGSSDATTLVESTLKEASPPVQAIAWAGLSTALAVRRQDGKAAELLAEAEKQLALSQPGGTERERAQAMVAVARALSFPETQGGPSRIDVSDPLAHARALRDLGVIRNAPEAKAQEWIVRALEIAAEEIPDTTRLMELAKSESPAKSGVIIAHAAAAMIRSLVRVRD